MKPFGRATTSQERGYTLIEVLTAIAIAGVLLTLAATALRHYWYVQSLSGAQDEVVSQLRAIQQNVTAESDPYVVGAWFNADAAGSQTRWGTVRYDPSGPSCVRQADSRFRSGVYVSGATFDNTPAAIAAMIGTCRTQVAGIPTTAKFVFFYARGTALDGTITLTQRNLGRSEGVTVTALTGRVIES